MFLSSSTDPSPSLSRIYSEFQIKNFKSRNLHFQIWSFGPLIINALGKKSRLSRMCELIDENKQKFRFKKLYWVLISYFDDGVVCGVCQQSSEPPDLLSALCHCPSFLSASARRLGGAGGDTCWSGHTTPVGSRASAGPQPGRGSYFYTRLAKMSLVRVNSFSLITFNI